MVQGIGSEITDVVEFYARLDPIDALNPSHGETYHRRHRWRARHGVEASSPSEIRTGLQDALSGRALLLFDRTSEDLRELARYGVPGGFGDAEWIDPSLWRRLLWPQPYTRIWTGRRIPKRITPGLVQTYNELIPGELLLGTARELGINHFQLERHIATDDALRAYATWPILLAQIESTGIFAPVFGSDRLTYKNVLQLQLATRLKRFREAVHQLEFDLDLVSIPPGPRTAATETVAN